MKKWKLSATMLGLFLATTPATQAAKIDLSSWSDEGAGSWSLQSGNDSVLQTINGDPTFFYNGLDSQGLALSGEITVTTSSDDDFIGFVLGYNAGDITNSAADYLLIDWKQGNQSSYGYFGAEGLAISRITDVMDLGAFWGDDAALGVEELQRGSTLGSVGWDDYTTYSFDLIFTSTLVQVYVDNNLELSVSGTFNDGSFGFYNYSQSNVLYSGITQTTAPPPVVQASAPATAGIFAISMLAFAVRRFRK